MWRGRVDKLQKKCEEGESVEGESGQTSEKDVRRGRVWRGRVDKFQKKMWGGAEFGVGEWTNFRKRCGEGESVEWESGQTSEKDLRRGRVWSGRVDKLQKKMWGGGQTSEKAL